MKTVHLLAQTIRSASILLLAAACLPLCAQVQGTPGPPMGAPNGPGIPSASGAPVFPNSNPPDPIQSRMVKDMLRERNSLRQKTIVEDTNQLLDLARQLKEAVDKSNKNQLSLNVVNTAAEIEKLAKAVKEKMRDGQ